jgi:hypothetical protein
MANRGRRGGPRDSDEDDRERKEHREDEKREHRGDALKQWHALPGAVHWPATDVEPPAPPAPDAGPKP